MSIMVFADITSHLETLRLEGKAKLLSDNFLRSASDGSEKDLDNAVYCAVTLSRIAKNHNYPKLSLEWAKKAFEIRPSGITAERVAKRHGALNDVKNQIKMLERSFEIEPVKDVAKELQRLYYSSGNSKKGKEWYEKAKTVQSRDQIKRALKA